MSLVNRIEERPLRLISVYRSGGLGDVLLLVPALRALRATHPSAHLRLFAPPEVGALLEVCAEVDSAGDCDQEGFGVLNAPSSQNIGHLRDAIGAPDLVIAFTRGASTASLALQNAGLVCICEDPLPPPGRHAAQHAVELLNRAGLTAVRWDGPDQVTPLSRDTRTRDDPTRSASRWTALLHPGAGARWKRAPVKLFHDLAEALTDCGFDVTFVAGPAELELLGEHAGQEAWISPRSPSDLARRLLAANLYVGNDSGVTHLAGLLGVPTVALFGPTHPLTWSPLGPRVRVIRACMVEPGREVRVCRDDDCMGAIRVEDVLDVCRAPFVPATAIL